MHAPVPASTAALGHAESTKKPGSSSGVIRNPLGPGAKGLNSPTIPSTGNNTSNTSSNSFSTQTQAQMSSQGQNQTSDGNTTSITKTIPTTVTTIANNNSSNINNGSSARITPSPSLARTSPLAQAQAQQTGVTSPLAQTQARITSPTIQPRVNSPPTNTRIDTTTVSALHSRHTTTRSGASHDADDEDDESGSGLDSPALSYSARTPASSSPATPFSAFGETFEGPPVAVVVGKSQEGPGNVGLGVGVGELPTIIGKTQTQ